MYDNNQLTQWPVGQHKCKLQVKHTSPTQIVLGIVTVTYMMKYQGVRRQEKSGTARGQYFWG